VSKLGRVIGFSAEAGIWIAGAALIASAAGMHWSVDLPKVDLSGLIPAKSAAVASGSPGTSVAPSASIKAVASATPVPSATAATVLARYQAFATNPGRQYFLAISATLNSRNVNGSSKTTVSGTAAGNGNDCSTSLSAVSAGASRKSEVVLLGSDVYERSNDGAWSKRTRESGLTCEEMGLLMQTNLVDKGKETKNGQPAHRLEVADPVQFSSGIEKLETGVTGQTLTQVTMSVWVKDDGTPIAVKFGGSHSQPNNGVPTQVTYTYDYTITKTSGVTISPPI